MLKSVRADSFDVIDLSRISHSKELTRIEKKVEDFSDIGQTVVKRARLEAEWRILGNRGLTEDKITNEELEPTDVDIIVMMLDPRTVKYEIGTWSPAMKQKAWDLLLSAYVTFALGPQNGLSSSGDTSSDPDIGEVVQGNLNW